MAIFGYHLIEPRNEWGELGKAILAECLGTMLFVFFGTGAVTSGCHISDILIVSGNGNDKSLNKATGGTCFLQSTTVLNIALAFGIMLFVVIYFCASFSGGHINPAVTLGMFLTRKISLTRGILYVIFQCGGAAVGSGLVKGIDKGGFIAADGAANQINRAGGFDIGSALGTEIILTFALVFTVFAATDAERAVSTAPLSILAPFSIGMVVFGCHLVAIPIDGCSVNPARSFGPAVIGHIYHDLWLFWAGPFIGAILASVAYELAFRTKITVDEANQVARVDVEKGVPPPFRATKPVYSGVDGLTEKEVKGENHTGAA